jgi:hypothetical protein
LAEAKHPLALFTYGKELYNELMKGSVAAALRADRNPSAKEIKEAEKQYFNIAYDYL